MEKAPSTDATASATTPVDRPAPTPSTPAGTPRAAPARRPVLVPVADSSAEFSNALSTHKMAARALADAAVKHLADRVHAAAGNVEFTVELTAAGASRLTCDALPETTARLLQATIVDQLSYAVLATTGRTPIRSHAASMTWRAGSILPSTHR